MSEGTSEIQRLKRRMARVLPMQLKGEFGLRAGEVRWIGGRETYLWIPEKLAVTQSYEVRVDLREQGRTVDGLLTVTEVHSTRKLRLRPGYLIVATYKIPDAQQRGFLNELLGRINPDDLAGSTTQPVGSRVRRPKASPPAERPTPSAEGVQPERDDPEAHEPASEPSPAPRSSARPAAKKSAPSARDKSGRVVRDRLALTPLGPPPKRRESAAESKEKQTRKIGRIPLGRPPKRKPEPVPGAAVAAVYSPGMPPSLFIQLQGVDQARGAIQGEPPELAVWLEPQEALMVGLRPTVAFQLPGGRFLEVTGLVSSRNPERALLTFPTAKAEDLHLLALARAG